MDAALTARLVEQVWNDSITPKLVEYIRIPNKSPLYDREWREQGHMERAVSLIEGWCREQPIARLGVDVVRLPGRTPVIFMEVPGYGEDCVLLYGHLDKQPEMSGWREGLGPWQPVLENEKLYGRGGADDGYSTFAALTAIHALQSQRIPHARCVILIEACEESGSYDLPYYIEALAERIGSPSLVVCLDSGCGNYDQLWCTTSLRGIVGGVLSVETLKEGVHSGDAGGIVPSTFRVLRQLLDRIEDARTGRILLDECHVDIPPERIAQSACTARILGESLYDKFPFTPGTRPVSDDLEELSLNRTWRPALAVTGAGGLPEIASAGNVARPMTRVKLSLRIPPTCDPHAAARALKSTLEAEPPYGARVGFDAAESSAGWEAPPFSAWLEGSMQAASQQFFRAPAAYTGEGGTIPFMAMLGARFPEAQFLITGVLGPQSNAHGPNEFLHIPTGKKLTGCVARVLADHFTRNEG